jgi:hypothetical protein
MSRRLLAALLSFVLVPLVAVVTASSPALAVNCATPGHTYVISGGTTYQSGFEGNYQNGVQRLVLPAATPFQVGANGIKPDTHIEFELVLGETTSPFWQIPRDKLARPKASGNCVANQTWVFPSTNPPVGTYSVRAMYAAGNSGAVINETIVFVTFT